MEEDPEVDPVGTNPFEEDDMENELQNGDAVGGKSYHDDSDDDMLLWWKELKWGRNVLSICLSSHLKKELGPLYAHA